MTIFVPSLEQTYCEFANDDDVEKNYFKPYSKINRASLLIC